MRWLAVVLALSLAAPASAKTLIVRARPFSGDNGTSAQQQYQNFTKMLERRGATFAETPIVNTRTLWMRTGLQVWGAVGSTAPTEQFDCIVIWGYDRNGSQPTGTSVDSLTLGAGWPAVPVVIVGAANVNPGKWTAAAACSTGVKTHGTAYGSMPFLRNSVYYKVGTTAPWKSMATNLNRNISLGAAVAGTTFRPIVAQGYSASMGAGAPSGNFLLRGNPDSTGYTSAGNDSVVMWVRVNNATNVPIIFVDPGGAPADLGLMAMAMQMADSASGGNVWDAPTAKPIQAALAITAVTSRGKYSNAMDTSPASTRITHLQGGTFCYADSCDSSNVLAGLDSLATLGGLKTTFFIEPCSLATYPNVKNWLSRAGQYRVGIQGAAGFGIATTQIMTAASATYPIDPLGSKRTRYAAQSSASCGNASDTALVSCNLLRGRQIIRNQFGDQIYDPSIFPAAGDWSPVAFTRAGGGPGIDSMAYALWKGGVRAVVIRPEWINTESGVSSTFSTSISQLSGATSPGLDPFGYGQRQRVLNVYDDPADPTSGIIGSVKIVAERGEGGMLNVANGGFVSHDTKTEWQRGLVDDVWFDPIIGHTHLFMTRTQVLHVSLGRLGGAATSTPARLGWWEIKHTHNAFEAANSVGWVDPVSGARRNMFEWVYVSELQP